MNKKKHLVLSISRLCTLLYNVVCLSFWVQMVCRGSSILQFYIYIWSAAWAKNVNHRAWGHVSLRDFRCQHMKLHSVTVPLWSIISAGHRCLFVSLSRKFGTFWKTLENRLQINRIRKLSHTMQEQFLFKCCCHECFPSRIWCKVETWQPSWNLQ